MSYFPSDIYKELVLKPAYDEAKEKLIKPMMQIHIAHTKMLEKQGLITKEVAEKIKKAIKEEMKKDYMKKQYTGKFEDLFFEVEHGMIESQGEEVGNIHIARSRNDMGITIYRMVLREKVLIMLDSVIGLKKSLIKKAEEHIETVMVGYTHTQQAQTTTLAHYLKAYIDKIDRDIERIMSYYNRLNKSPMGSAALTTTGFDIDRKSIAEDLAFEGLIKNSWDAVAGADYLAEVANVVQLIALNMGRFSQDLLTWATQEFGSLKLSAGFVQISSIMPQKRNPVGVEHTRSISSSIVGDTNTVIQMIHNTPFGDIVDTEDDLQPYIWRAIDKTANLAKMMGEYIKEMDIDKKKLRERAEKSYSNITELADELVRKEGISFRQSHEVVSTLIKKEDKEDIRDLSFEVLKEVYKEIIKKEMVMNEQEFKESLTPSRFISTRKIEGSPQKEVMEKALEESKKIMKEQIKEKEKKENEIKKMNEKLIKYLNE